MGHWHRPPARPPPADVSPQRPSMAPSPLAALLALAAARAAGAASPWPASAAADAAATLAKMSAQNKFDMVHGWGGDYVGDVPVIGPLSDGSFIPALHLHDGPQGVANGNKDVTCWPAALTVVQTWDPEAMYAYGEAMGREQYLKGSNVMLGPGVNLARLPWNGRNVRRCVWSGVVPGCSMKRCGTRTSTARCTPS